MFAPTFIPVHTRAMRCNTTPVGATIGRPLTIFQPSGLPVIALRVFYNPFKIPESVFPPNGDGRTLFAPTNFSKRPSREKRLGFDLFILRRLSQLYFSHIADSRPDKRKQHQKKLRDSLPQAGNDRYYHCVVDRHYQ